MNELQHLGLYARELKKHLPRSVFEPVPARLLWLIPHLAVLIGGALAITLLPWPLWAKLPVSLLMGLSLACLGFLAHEVLHGSVVRTPWLRDAIGGALFSPFGLSPRLWRRWHNVEHHGHTQHPGLDPDAFDTLESYDGHVGVRLLSKLPPQARSALYFVSFAFWFSLHSLLILRTLRGRLPARERRLIVLQTAAPYLLWLALLIWVGPGPFALLYVLPVLVGNFVVIAYIATNHGLNPMTETNDPLVNSLSVTNPRWLDWLHLNFSHHVEHHVLPSVNPVHAPRIKALLKRLYPERYHELPWGTALRALWNTPRFYGADRVSFVDPEGRRFGTLGHGLEPEARAPRAPRPAPLRRLYGALREPVSGLTHWLGAALSLGLLAVLLVWAHGRGLPLWPFAVFGVSAALLYLASASYHTFRVSKRALAWLRKLDHGAIFLLIAGSYTPLAYFGLGGATRTAVLSALWGVALGGIVLKLATMRLPRWVSTALYLAMGWMMIVVLPQLVRALPGAALVWLGVGGLLYTLGAVVYGTKKLDFRPGVFGFHEVWHLFVLGGTGATFAMALSLA